MRHNASHILLVWLKVSGLFISFISFILFILSFHLISVVRFVRFIDYIHFLHSGVRFVHLGRAVWWCYSKTGGGAQSLQRGSRALLRKENPPLQTYRRYYMKSLHWGESLWNRRVAYLAICSSVHSFARTARALRCAHSFARSLTLELMGKRFLYMKWARGKETEETSSNKQRNLSRNYGHATMSLYLPFCRLYETCPP